MHNCSAVFRKCPVFPSEADISSYDDSSRISWKYEMQVTEVEYIVQWAEDNRSYEQKYKEQMCFHM